MEATYIEKEVTVKQVIKAQHCKRELRTWITIERKSSRDEKDTRKKDKYLKQ